MALTKSQSTLRIPFHKISKQLRDYYYNQDTPPTDQLIVPTEKIAEHPAPGYEKFYTAILIYVGYYPTKKTHVVTVGFALDKQGNVLTPSLHYA